MFYNSTKVQIDVPFHEELYLSNAINTWIWREDYYELLEIIGDDYE